MHFYEADGSNLMKPNTADEQTGQTNEHTHSTSI